MGFVKGPLLQVLPLLLPTPFSLLNSIAIFLASLSFIAVSMPIAPLVSCILPPLSWPPCSHLYTQAHSCAVKPLIKELTSIHIYPSHWQTLEQVSYIFTLSFLWLRCFQLEILKTPRKPFLTMYQIHSPFKEQWLAGFLHLYLFLMLNSTLWCKSRTKKKLFPPYHLSPIPFLHLHSSSTSSITSNHSHPVYYFHFSTSTSITLYCLSIYWWRWALIFCS